MAAAEGELDVGAADRRGQGTVLVLGIDDEDLVAGSGGGQGDRLQQIGLAGPGMAEDGDVGVFVVAVGEGIDGHRHRGRPAATERQSGRVGHLDVEPGEQRDQRRGIDEVPSAKLVESQRQGRQAAVELPEDGLAEAAES